MNQDDGQPQQPATRKPRGRKSGGPPVCHPERPHQARGLCRECYEVAFRSRPRPGATRPVPGLAIESPAIPPDLPRRTSLEIALEIGDYWRVRCVITMEQLVTAELEIGRLQARVAEAVEQALQHTLTKEW